MKRTRQQNGYVFAKGNNWYLRYREDVLQGDGSIKHMQRCVKLAERAGATRSRDAARELADEFLKPLNEGSVTARGTMPLNRFIEEVYLPYVKEQRELSTYRGYRNVWHCYFEARGEVALRDIRTCEAEAMLRDIARSFDLTKRTLTHLKHFLGGVFAYAIRVGVLTGANPIREVDVPRGRPSAKTHACSLEEILAYVELVPEPAATIIAAAAFTGPRRGELRAYRWENYRNGEIEVVEKVWGTHVGTPKCDSSGDIPVIPLLARYLDRHRMACGDPGSGYIFANSLGKPMDLDRLVSQVIRPALANAGFEWHGWHAFRRGLATNLHRLKVPDKMIQRILRHANIRTTQDIYIKTVDEDMVAAMQRLDAAVSAKMRSKNAAPARVM